MENTTEAVSPRSCADRATQEQTSIITVTNTVQISVVTVTQTISVTPQSSCSCQQQTDASSSSDCNAVNIWGAIGVAIGVIAVIVLIVIGILIWRKVNSWSDALFYDKFATSAMMIQNDLHGLVYITIRYLCYVTL